MAGSKISIEQPSHIAGHSEFAALHKFLLSTIAVSKHADPSLASFLAGLLKLDQGQAPGDVRRPANAMAALQTVRRMLEYAHAEARRTTELHMQAQQIALCLACISDCRAGDQTNGGSTVALNS